MELDPGVAAAGVRLFAHALLGSTNGEALQLARRGEHGPLWVVAERQSAGRGRRGRSWISEPGNLYASLLLTRPAPVRHWPELSFVAALAVHDAIATLAFDLAPRLAIKWPNDLLIAGAKVAGILVEGEGGETGAVVAGIGVNCACHPTNVQHSAIDLTTAGAALSPGIVFRSLSVKMAARLAQWDRGAGFSSIRADWLVRATGLGEEVRVRVGDRHLCGCFEALDESGGLVLRLPSGRTATVAAGDVVLSSPASKPVDRN
jgi:BirA family biotin operon repressor/biotin-[acetyl-CoA-carboxylase] ligase